MVKYRDVVVFCLMACLTNGCARYVASSVTNYEELNSQLTYLPWWSTGDELLADENKELNSLDLEPGMRLTVNSLPISKAGKVRTLVLPATYQWVVPAPGVDGTIGSYGRADFFFLDWLMINGVVGDKESHDLEDSFRKLGTSLRVSVEQGKTKVPDGRYFSDLLGDRVMGEWINPERWLVRTAKPAARLLYLTKDPSNVTSHRYTVEVLRRRMRAAAAGDFPDTRLNIQHARRLKMTLELKDVDGTLFSSRTLSVLDGDDWFFTNVPSDFRKDERHNKEWIKCCPSFNKARGMIDVEIAVRTRGDATPIYLPGDTSVAELEKLLGRQIKGFRRPAHHINTLLPSEKERSELLVSEGGTEFAAFYFRKEYVLFDPYFRARHVYRLAPDAKEDVVVGHGDILIE